MNQTPSQLHRAVLGDPSGPSVQATVRLSLDQREMAIALGISKNHLANLTRDGVIPVSMLGAKPVYPIDLVRQRLAELVRTHDQEQPPSPA